MNLVRFACLALLGLVATPAVAQIFTIPPGAYRTAAAYHRRLPQPAGLNASYPDKRGTQTTKLRVAPDSLWGYVNSKGRSFRLYRGQEYRLEHADTLCVYSQTSLSVNQALGGTNNTSASLFFSRGLTGLIFPLTPRYLREAYEASNPSFAAAVGKLRFDQSLADFDKKTGLYRVTTVYRESLGK
jgi:hypothetical protein